VNFRQSKYLSNNVAQHRLIERVSTAAKLATAFVVVSVTFSTMDLLPPAISAVLGPIDGANTPLAMDPMSHVLDLSELVQKTAPTNTKLPYKKLQEVPNEVPLGFRKAFLRARAEQQKNGSNVFRYIQKGNIKGLTDSQQNGIGPGHGKSSSALEAAIASVSLKHWSQVRLDALNNALGNQSFNNFSISINQRQRKAKLPELTKSQLRNFMDISFWRSPAKGEHDMAKETGDSEYYQLPQLTSSVRASLINIKLKYQQHIVSEAVATYGLTGRPLHDKLTREQHLSEAEAKFVSAHLDAARFVKPENKTQALLRFGSEPYIRPPATTSSKPPGKPPTTVTSSGEPPLLLFTTPDTPSDTFSPPIAPPLAEIADTPSNTFSPPVAPLPLVTPPVTSSDTFPLSLLPLALLPIVIPLVATTHHTSSSNPPWNRPVVVMGPPVAPVSPVVTRAGGGFPNTPQSPPTVDIPPISLAEQPIEQPIYVSVPTVSPVPQPNFILGTVAAGAGLLVIRVKASNRKHRK